MSADLAEIDGSARVVAEAIAWNNGQAPDIVWCIAGASTPGLFVESPREHIRHHMDVNYMTCADMAHAILSEWLAPESLAKSKERHLVFTSSVAALVSISGYATYSPSKAAIKSLSDALAQEMLLYTEDVKIHTVFPGTITSRGFENEQKTKPEITKILEESDPVQTPDVVAAAAISGLEKGEYLVTVAWLGTLMRGLAWNGSMKNNLLVDTIVSWVAGIVIFFANMDMDSKIRGYRKKHGHPRTYTRKV